MTSLLPQLLPHEKKDIRYFEGTHDLRSPLAECLARAWDFEALFRAQGWTGDQLRRHVANCASRCPHWTPEQVRTALALRSLRENVGLSLSIARRILRDDPAELALGECLEVRLEWLTRRLAEQSGEGPEDDDIGLIPMALAVRDRAAAERLAASPAQSKPDPVGEWLTRAIAGAYRRDPDAMRPAARSLLQRTVDPSMKGMCRCLAGIAEGDAGLVAEGLRHSLDEQRQARMKKQARGVIDFDTHGFYRLAEWVSVDLVAGFDVAHALPWDAEFHWWTEAHPNAAEELDLNAVSPELHAMLVELKLPVWCRAA